MVSAAILVNVYEEDIKAYALAEISSNLKSDISVKAVDLTLWGQFPQASLQFKDVIIDDTFSDKDTLISAENIFLNFSLTDFIKGNYTVKEVFIENALISLKRLKSGEDNYHFWLDSDSTKSEFKIDLEKVALQSTTFKMIDDHSNVSMNIFASEADIKGNITSSSVTLAGDLDTDVSHLTVSGKSYIYDKTISGHTELLIDLEENLYTITETNLTVNELPLAINGDINLEDAYTHLSLVAETENTDLTGVLNNLPTFVQEKLSAYHLSGDFSTCINISGKSGGNYFPDISADFELFNGNIENGSSGMALSDISTKGTYNAPHKEEDLLTFSSLSCALHKSQLTGSGEISRLTNPFINVSLSGNLDLNSFSEFFNLSQVETLDGLAEVNLKYKGNLGKNWEPSTTSIRLAEVSGTLKLIDSTLKLHSNPHKIEDINGELLLTKSDAAVNGLTAVVDESDFKFDGFFRNLVPYLLLPSEKLTVASSLKSDFLNLNSLMSSTGEASENYAVNFPENINFDLSVEINELSFRQFKATAVRAQAKMNSKNLSISPLSLNTSGGGFSASINALQRENGQIKVTSTGDLNEVDISALFMSMEDFHQEFLTHNHLKGSATSHFTLSTELTPYLEVISPSVIATADITLKNGELINHSALADIGDYLQNKKLISAVKDMNRFKDELAHVKFSELNNRIEIENEKISIPKMDVISDVLDIKAEGTHSFNNDINYSVGFDLADFTARKEWSDDEKGLSKNIFVSMTGNTSAPQFSYDRLAVKENRQENRREEKKKIKKLLKDEFSKNKTSSAAQGQQVNDERVTIEWSDSEEQLKEKSEKENLNINKPNSLPNSSINISTEAEIEDDDDF